MLRFSKSSRTVLALLVICLIIALTSIWLGGSSSTSSSLVITRDSKTGRPDPFGATPLDVTGTAACSIAVWISGVQIRTEAGWKTVHEDYRGECWLIKPGASHRFCVERPQAGTWRAFIRYSSEIHGPSVLKAQIREGFHIRSFSNWTGKPWGGRRYSGSYELFSTEFKE